jgi:hypothetical protein
MHTVIFEDSSLLVTVDVSLLGFARLLRFVELNCIIDIAQYRAEAVFVLHVQLKERHHTETIDELRHSLVQLVERSTIHQAVRGRRIYKLLLLFFGRHFPRRVIVNQVCVDIHKALQVALGHLALDEIHLAQYVDVRHFEHHHGAHGGQRAREELGPVDDEGRFEEVGGAHANVERAMHERLDKAWQYRHMCVQLDLARHVKHDQIVLGDFLERIGQEVEVLHEELEAVDKAAIGTETHLLHDILETDQVFDVEVGLECELLGGGVEVHVKARTLGVLEVLNEGGAEGTLSYALSASTHHIPAARQTHQRPQGPFWLSAHWVSVSQQKKGCAP